VDSITQLQLVVETVLTELTEHLQVVIHQVEAVEVEEAQLFQ